MKRAGGRQASACRDSGVPLSGTPRRASPHGPHKRKPAAPGTQHAGRGTAEAGTRAGRIPEMGTGQRARPLQPADHACRVPPAWRYLLLPTHERRPAGGHAAMRRWRGWDRGGGQAADRQALAGTAACLFRGPLDGRRHTALTNASRVRQARNTPGAGGERLVPARGAFQKWAQAKRHGLFAVPKQS